MSLVVWWYLLLASLAAGVMTTGEVIELHQARQQSESFLRGQIRAILLFVQLLEAEHLVRSGGR